ncbi:PAS domain S-box-containing protein [Dethiosulfatibacter aminovorans DSM 17477]|uniref:HTH-type transcriptional regulatory protein TyrR n=1 Tax=Dethiosulfatibacter aminovorans DSM 17477 TaxID=1121476 RepID=A0A1M6MKY8_9FIRM|nr:sigma 54-interacting transcriptional regulator [Dethiosulfatibacter aminovorans]SHJ84127.1 PAS domain S-box-containing protein [Dethiosulfatibacter aminovorans DSM 17477]
MKKFELDEMYKKMEDLEKQYKIQKEIFENSYDGMYITDGKGYTLDVNEAYLNITGLKKNELIGFHMDELINRGYFKESVSIEIIRSGKPKSLIDIFQNGKRCLITGTPVFNDEGEVYRVVTNVRDMTDLMDLQKTLEETRELNAKYENELLYLRNENMEKSDIVGQSKKFRNLMNLVYRVAETDATVLITGETGTGKEIVAREIHRRSKRVDKPFIKVNCAAIPENLLESELFGYEKGAFTGASKNKPGMFELANEGTILLDEIGEMNILLQSKLLRVIQNMEITRLGGVDTIPIDVRLVASTNRNMKKLVDDGSFREDLFYRLNVIPIRTPPLRDRKEDIALLAKYFLTKFNKKYSISKKISGEAIEILSIHSWPGNIRELENLLERLVVTCGEDIIEVECLLNHIDLNRKEMISSVAKIDGSFNERIEALEKRMLQSAADKCRNTREVAGQLGISQPTVVRKMKKYNIRIIR